jgi:hypothetical protein
MPTTEQAVTKEELSSAANLLMNLRHRLPDLDGQERDAWSKLLSAEVALLTLLEYAEE